MSILDWIGGIYFLLLFIYLLGKTAMAVRIVPAKEAFIVERLGKYSRTLEAGFHLLLPFLDRTVGPLSRYSRLRRNRHHDSKGRRPADPRLQDVEGREDACQHCCC